MGKKQKKNKKDVNEEVVKLEKLTEDEIEQLEQEKTVTAEPIEATELADEEVVINKFEVVNKKRYIPVVVTCVIVLLLVVFGGFSLANKLNKNIYKNVYLENINLGGMNLEEVNKIVKEISEKFNDSVKIDIVQGDKVINTLSQGDINFKIDEEKTVKNVFAYGRSSNIFVNNYNVFKSLFVKKVIPIEYTYDEKEFEELCDIISSSVQDKVLDDSFEVDEEEHELVLTKGKKGNGINKEVFEKEIIDVLKTNKNATYNIKLVQLEPKKLNMDNLYKEIKRDAKDAEVIEEKGKKPVFKKEIYGHDIEKEELFNSLEKLKVLNPGETINIKLKVIEPKVKYQDISWTKFEDVLGSLTTRFPASNKNRATNINIALSKLNGVLVMPGEVFSFNKIIGDTTAAKGYRPAATFKGAKVVDEVGGGICQTVSTLYNAVLYANLQIVSRKAHSLPVGYVRPGLDATMYYPGIDFKFKNTRNYPIKIVTSFSWNGNMTISIMGTKEEVEYKVVLSSKITSRKPFETIVEVDNNMAPGTQIVKHNGVDGYTTEAYKTTKLNGKVVKTELLSKDVYKPSNKLIVKGPDKVNEPVEVPVIPEENNNEVEVPVVPEDILE